MLGTHQVSLASFDAMAEGRSDPAIVEQLELANRSRQLVLLRAVLDRARALAPALTPLPTLDEAWQLLANAQQLDKAAVDQVVLHPRTGLWAATALRRLRRTNAVDGNPPLWAELGYLHQLATAAAIRARHDFRSRVPVWRGTVMLPTLGLADVQGHRDWDFAQVHSEHGTVLIRGPAGSVQLPANPSVDGYGWMALRTVRAGGRELWLDDLDPYREFDGPVEPHRLSTSEVDLWTDDLREMWRMLAKYHPATAAELSTGLTTLVPRAATDPFEAYSASHNDAFGAVVLSRPPDTTSLAATLVHEFQHSKFGVLLTLVDLLDPNADNNAPRLYAPWRDDPRPPTGVLHGLFSFLGVTAFYRERHLASSGPAGRAAGFEFAYRREQTMRAVELLSTEATPSVLGHRFLTTTQHQLQRWAADPLPEDVREAAHRANVDHYLSWRLRHLRPPAEVVDELTYAWLRHRSKPVAAATAPLLKPASGTISHPRLAILRIWLTKPDLYDVYRAEPELLMAEIAGTTTADLALIDGKADIAAELYQRQIHAAPESLSAWAGLAMTSANEALRGRPELVLAVHREIRSRCGVTTNPVRLAQWLS
jgi:HEXXH motif-containing protein